MAAGVPKGAKVIDKDFRPVPTGAPLTNSIHRVLCTILTSGISAISGWSQTPVARPRFEVASVKRNMSCRGRRGGGGPPTPGRLTMECATLQTLVENAYYIFADGRSMNPKAIEILGGPSWMLSDFYDISAKAEDGAGFAQMSGPMMQALLEDRFKLKTHRQSKEAPVYFLTVAKDGPKLEPTNEGSCATVDLNHPLVPVTGQPTPVRCGSQGTSFKDGIVTMTWRGTTMDLLANDAGLSRAVRLPIVDRTGLSGQFDIHLEFAPEMPTPASGDAGTPTNTGTIPPGQSILEAFQKLGLRLEPGKGSIDVLVIDHLERPAGN